MKFTLFIIGLLLTSLLVLSINLSTLGNNDNSYLYQVSSSGCSTTQINSCSICPICIGLDPDTCMCSPSGCENQCTSSSSSGGLALPFGNSCTSTQTLTCSNCDMCNSIDPVTCMCSPPGCEIQCILVPPPPTTPTCGITTTSCNCPLCTSVDISTCTCQPSGCEGLCSPPISSSGSPSNIPFCSNETPTCLSGTPVCTSGFVGVVECRQIALDTPFIVGCTVSNSFVTDNAICSSSDGSSSTSTGSQNSNIITYIIVDGPGAGTQIFQESGTGTSIIKDSNPITEAEGIINFPNKKICPGPLARFNGRLFGLRDPNLLMCGWGHVILINDSSNELKSISSIIMKELSIKQSVNQEGSNITLILNDLTNTIEDIEDLQNTITLMSSIKTSKANTETILNKLQESISNSKSAISVIKRLEKFNLPREKKKNIKAANSKLDSSIEFAKSTLPLIFKSTSSK